MMNIPEGALTGLKVLDFTHYVAGPYCTKLMADYGAEVIKVERLPDGDGSRRMGPYPGDEPHREKSAQFLHLNTNKRGIAVDLKQSRRPPASWSDWPHGPTLWWKVTGPGWQTGWGSATNG